MIVVVAESQKLVRKFLETWGRPLQRRVWTMHLDDAGQSGQLPRATYIFVDLERLTPERRAHAAQIADVVRAAGMPVLNDPTRVKGRFDLLRTLQDHGTNRASVHRVTDLPDDVDLPVFVRREHDHLGPLTPLLGTRAELDEALDHLLAAGEQAAELIVVGFVDTSDDDGLFRKYGVFRFGDRVVRGHLLTAEAWSVKRSKFVPTAAMRDEAAAFAEGGPGPEDDELRSVFDVAGIDYGRIDYAYADGDLQVWEINTNPNLSGMPHSIPEPALALEARQAQRFRDAFAALDEASPPKGWIDVDLPPAPGTPSVPRGTSDASDDVHELRRRLREAERERDRALERLASAAGRAGRRLSLRRHV